MATTQAPTETVPAGPGGLTHKQILTIIVGLMFGMLLAALDQTIVSTAIRTIGDELGDLKFQAWVTTAYLITSTVTTPLYGKLSDIYGRRPLFLTAISLFIIGSLASSFATSMPQLAAFRAFQGLGAGGLFSLSFAILADIVPARERARYQGYFLAVFGMSSVIGPLVGGFFAGANTILGISGWRWVFLINVPIGLVALIVVYRVLHLPHIRRDHRIDWWGAVALIVGIVPVLIVAEQGSQWGWGSTRILSLIAIAIIGIAAFIFVEFRMKDEALIPMRLFKASTFSLGLSVNALVGVGMFGAISMLPLYLQLVKGATPTSSGLLLLPLMAGLMIGSIASGQLTSKTGKYKIFPVIGTALLTVSFLLLLTITVNTGYVQLDIYFLMVGLGLGLCMQTLLIAVQNAVPARDVGVATSSATFFRQLGGTLGVGIFLSLLFNTLPGNINSAVKSSLTDQNFAETAGKAAAAAGKSIQEYLANLGSQLTIDSSFLSKIDPVIAHPYQVGFVSSTHVVYICGAICMAVAFGLVMMIKQVPLRTMSAIQENQMEQASMDAETLRNEQSAVAATGADLRQESNTASAAPKHEPAHSPDAVGHPVAVADLIAESDVMPDGQTVGSGPEHGKHEA